MGTEYVFQQTGGEYLTECDVMLNFLRREGEREGGGVRNGRRSEIVYITAADMRDKISGYHTVTRGGARLRYHVGIVVVCGLWCNTGAGIPTPTTTTAPLRLRSLQSSQLVASIELV